MKDFLVGTYLYHESTGENQVKLLSGVLGQMYRLMLQFIGVFISYPIWFCKLILELGSHIHDIYSSFLCCLLPHTFSCYSVGCKSGRTSLKKISNINSKGQGTFMDKCEGEIHLSRFISFEKGKTYFRLLRHFSFTIPHDLPHISDSFCDFQELAFCCLCLHFYLQIKKTRPKRNSLEFFETSLLL